MAAPLTNTVHNLNGVWVMNKALGDNPDPALAIQGFNWAMRKILCACGVTVTVTQYTAESGHVHIDISSTIVGGIKVDPEYRILSGEWADDDHRVFGKLKVWSKFMKRKELDDEYLAQGWVFDGEGEESGEEELIGTYAESVKDGWKSMSVWGFEIVEGVRKYTRRIVVSKGDKVAKIRQVYDYKGIA